MQHHHPGSWYLPWGVPLQKMLAVPMHHPGAPSIGFHQSPQATALQVQQSSAQQHQNYQHQIHPALAAHHTSAALHQPIHPAAAAAMFTPLSLRTFINPSGNHLSLSPQQTMTSAVQQASSNQSLQSQKQQQSQLAAINLNVGVVPIRSTNSNNNTLSSGSMIMPVKKVISFFFFHFYVYIAIFFFFFFPLYFYIYF